METLSKCRALVTVNAEMAARCKAKPVLCRVAGRCGVLTLEWRWKPNVQKQLRKLEQVWEIGPFSLRSTEASAALDALAGSELLLVQLQERLEEQHVALGKLESKCLAVPAVRGKLPLMARHSYVESLSMTLPGEHALKLVGFLLKAPETEIAQFAAPVMVAASWLAYYQFGYNTIVRFREDSSLGIDLVEKEGRWHGVANYGEKLYRFRFAQLGDYEFGQLEIESLTHSIEKFSRMRTHPENPLYPLE